MSAELSSASAAHRWEIRPQSTMRVETADEVASILDDSRRARRTVMPIGLGTSLAYLGLPNPPDLGLELDGLRGVVEFTPGDLTICARAGTPIEEIRETAAGRGLWLPGLPSGAGTLGGWVACGETSPFGCETNGTLRERVLGVEIATTRGERARSGGRVVKNVAGYDLHRMYPGSGGALGVITEITLRLEPQPEHAARLDLVAEEEAAEAAFEWQRRHGPDLDVLAVRCEEGERLRLAAFWMGDREPVEAAVHALRAGWERHGSVEPGDPSERALEPPLWRDPSDVLAATVRARPSRILPQLHAIRAALSRIEIETTLVGFPALGRIEIAASGEVRTLPTVWRLLAEEAREGEWHYKIQNEPPRLPSRYPGFSARPVTLRLYQRLKNALDPDGVLRPGSYSVSNLEAAVEYFESRPEESA